MVTGAGIMVVVGVQVNKEVPYYGGSGGKRIDACIASTLPDWGSNRWLVVEFYVNGRHVHFLVCGPPNLALPRRYNRFFIGAIICRKTKGYFWQITGPKFTLVSSAFNLISLTLFVL